MPTNPSDLRSVSALAAHVEQGHTPKYLFFWGHQPQPNGSIGKSCFSQWFEAPFSVDDTVYATAEHFMMAEKARLFGDEVTRARIVSARTPALAKKLGREVKGFEDTPWLAARFAIVVAGNFAKFSQHAALADFLRRTGNQVLVEASPADSIWGIGLAADHPDAQAPRRWPGLNLLGFALMEVRAALAREPGRAP